jgi:hypothetical protein
MILIESRVTPEKGAAKAHRISPRKR